MGLSLIHIFKAHFQQEDVSRSEFHLFPQADALRFVAL